MDMYFSSSPIKLEKLREKGFVVEEHQNEYSSLQYDGNEAVVLIEKDDNGNKYVTDIAKERGTNNLEVIKKLYEFFDMRLIDETSGEWEDYMHMDLDEESSLKYIQNIWEKTKKRILSDR